MTITRFRVLAFVLVVFLVVGCSAALGGKPNWQKSMELISDRIAEQTTSAVPYPEAQMKDSLERRNLRERLLRFNKPQKVGYLYLVSFGKFVGYYVIKGKISSTQSQMTNTDQTWHGDGYGDMKTDSIGDDGSFGPNEGGEAGVFFFTAQGVIVETTLDWVYSDSPLKVDVPNLLGR